MSFIKKIFENKSDDSCHKQFTRFGKGAYINRAVYEISLSKDIKFKGTFEYCNELVEIIAMNCKDEVKVSGAIVAWRDIGNEFKEWLTEAKKRGGVFTYNLNFEMNSEDFKKFVEKYKNEFLLLTIDTSGMNLKCKTVLPKPGSVKEDIEKVKVGFCVANFSDSSLLKDYYFDVQTKFKKLKVSHDFLINDIVFPKEYENDFAEARLHAKRKGKVIRHLDVDGRKEDRECELLA